MRLDFWDKVDSPAFILIHDLCIDLGSAHIGVAKKFGDGVEFRHEKPHGLWKIFFDLLEIP